MFEIDRIKIDSQKEGCITDSDAPILSFSLKSDKKETSFKSAEITVGENRFTTNEQLGIPLQFKYEPFSRVEVKIKAEDDQDDVSEKSTCFYTGRKGTPWTAKWITDSKYNFPKKTSPAPFTFRKDLSVKKEIRRAYVNATALGIYVLFINGKRVGDRYFTPGFTSYRHNLQYDMYDVTEMLKENNEITAVVSGGWAVGRFTYSSKSRITCKRQAFCMELFIEYEDGEKEKIITDRSWQVTLDGSYRFGDFYDGEFYDSTRLPDKAHWKNADIAKIGFKPNINRINNCPVIRKDVLHPIFSFPSKSENETIYDFGQNFAGVICLHIKNAVKGQKITVRHAEIITDGELNVKSLRTAKAEAVYICNDGEQTYSPLLTYMGFRYAAISGISPDDVEVSAYVLYSDIEENGKFECSDERLNRLQSNIVWSGRSNFVDIPTDCPQRDERMGWTGDISVFAKTACFDFDMSAFLEKWLRDVRSEQGRGGGIPLVVPKQGISAPTVATACWGDSIILVPWAEYLARGDKKLLSDMYPAMKKYLKAVKFWASLSGFGKYRKHIWKWLFQFGDWCAPEGGVMDWMKKGKWIATAYYANSLKTMSKIAEILGETEDSEIYEKRFASVSEAYRHVFTDGNGKLKKEFQTGYVLPIVFEMAEGEEKEEMSENLVRLIENKDYHLNTGFTGTPHILFALSDSGHKDAAYRLLMQDTPPSWLYLIDQGATTTWEEWTIDPHKEGNIPSFNHYAYGAVGDFLYRRVAGIEPVEGGYERFRIQPVLGGDLTYAKASVQTPYGTAGSCWKIENGRFVLHAVVPVSCVCEVIMPSGKTYTVQSGGYDFEEEL